MAHRCPTTSSTLSVGTTVTHIIPSMLYAQRGTIVAPAGTKHGVVYWTVEYTHPTTQRVYQTPFASFVLHVSS